VLLDRPVRGNEPVAARSAPRDRAGRAQRPQPQRRRAQAARAPGRDASVEQPRRARRRAGSPIARAAASRETPRSDGDAGEEAQARRTPTSRWRSAPHDPGRPGRRIVSAREPRKRARAGGERRPRAPGSSSTRRHALGERRELGLDGPGDLAEEHRVDCSGQLAIEPLVDGRWISPARAARAAAHERPGASLPARAQGVASTRRLLPRRWRRTCGARRPSSTRQRPPRRGREISELRAARARARRPPASPPRSRPVHAPAPAIRDQLQSLGDSTTAALQARPRTLDLARVIPPVRRRVEPLTDAPPGNSSRWSTELHDDRRISRNSSILPDGVVEASDTDAARTDSKARRSIRGRSRRVVLAQVLQVLALMPIV